MQIPTSTLVGTSRPNGSRNTCRPSRSRATEWPDCYEPLDTFHERIVTAIDAMVARHPKQVVAVFCHRGVIARYTAAVLKLPWEQSGFFYPLYTSITRIGGSASGRIILTLNETPQSSWHRPAYGRHLLTDSVRPCMGRGFEKDALRETRVATRGSRRCRRLQTTDTDDQHWATGPGRYTAGYTPPCRNCLWNRLARYWDLPLTLPCRLIGDPMVVGDGRGDSRDRSQRVGPSPLKVSTLRSARSGLISALPRTAKCADAKWTLKSASVTYRSTIRIWRGFSTLWK
ncbi:hypothetical protein GTV32_17655 [Gordonia sp. SID5947]|nr:hypothetical protein [Gordonia sp. SID5947]